MKRKYFFFDIDGTITVRETGEPVPSAVRAIHKVEEAGHFVAIATGRAQYKARPFMERIGMKNMVLTISRWTWNAPKSSPGRRKP